MSSQLLIYLAIFLLVDFILFSIWIIKMMKKGQKSYSPESIFGRLLITLLFFFMFLFGEYISAEFKTLSLNLVPIDHPKYYSVLVLGIRVVVFCLGLFLLIKTVRPFVKSYLLVHKFEIAIFTDKPTAETKRASWPQLIGFVVSSFMLGFGFPAIYILIIVVIAKIMGL
jgi:hypothetical protein